MSMIKAFAASAAIAMTGVSRGETFTAFPQQDNTLYQSIDGSLSNGAGNSLFAGVTNVGEIRRALVQFDLSALPSGATITNATLRITQDRQGPGGAGTFALHRLLASWGEATSSGSGGGGIATANDATWIHRFYPTSQWTTPGGDFDPTLLSAAAFTGIGDQTFASSTELVAAVQGWVDSPAQNFGLIVKEQSAVTGVSARFFSRDNADVMVRPLLGINFDRLVTSWNTDSDGTWNTVGNWSAGVPGSFGIVARLAGAITAPRTISLPTSHTVGELRFESALSYTLAGAGQLNLDNGNGFVSRVDVLAGNHRIESMVTSSRELVIDVAISSDLYVAELNSAAAVTKAGGGSLLLGTASANGFNVSAGQVALGANVASVLTGLSVSAGANLNLDHSGAIQPTLPAELDAQTALRSEDIAAGRISTSGAGLLVGIARSSDLSITSFMGRPVPTSSVLFRATFAGDGNLDGTVNFDDLLSLAQHYGLVSGARWIDGDSNRDGKINFDDLLALAQRYGSSLGLNGEARTDADLHVSFASDWQLALLLVPEPTAAIASLLITSCLRRRR